MAEDDPSPLPTYMDLVFEALAELAGATAARRAVQRSARRKDLGDDTKNQLIP